MTRDFAARLAALREEFVRNAIGKLEVLDETLARLAARPADEAMLDRAMRLFHSLAGSGATYGFPEVSRSAGAAETLCDEIAAAGRQVTKAEVNSMLSEVAAIRRALLPEPAADGDDSSEQRILIIDGDAETAAFLRMVLESAGYSVRTCADIDYAAIDCNTFQPHLLLIRDAAAVALAPATLALLESGRRTLSIDSVVSTSADPSEPAPAQPHPGAVIKRVMDELAKTR